MKEYNVLILDDITFVGEHLEKRFFETSRFYSENLGIELKPHFEPVQIGDCYKETLKNIGDSIVQHKIDYLILDRGFNYIENIKGDRFSVKTEGKIYVDKLLKDIPNEYYKRIKGIIIYTYIPEELENDFNKEKFVESIYEILLKRINKENIQIILCNSEIYKLARLKLYGYDYDGINHKISNVTGSISEFKLYGLFMGEILYHRLIQMINKQKNILITKGRGHNTICFVIYFLAFTGLSIGSNALYNFLLDNHIGKGFLLFVCSLLIPMFILLTNPKWMTPVSFDREDN